MVQWLERLSPTSPRANAQKEIGFISALKKCEHFLPIFVYLCCIAQHYKYDCTLYTYMYFPKN